MSKFACPVMRVQEVMDHPNADRLSVVKLEGLDYVCISAKHEDGSDRYRVGDLVIYIPSAAVLPEWLLRSMNFWDDAKGKGTLAGSEGNRVKPLKLRGIFSEGLLYPVENECVFNENIGDSRSVSLGQDVSAFLDIVKYEPPIPVHMAGEVMPLWGAPKKFDVENIKNYPHVLKDGDHVNITEKLHGTFCQVGFDAGPQHDNLWGFEGTVFVCSKGLGNQGLVFERSEANRGNLYVKTLTDLRLDEKVERIAHHLGVSHLRVMGEIYGCVQDLTYGMSNGATAFRVFDIWDDSNKRWLGPNEVRYVCAIFGLECVPTLAEGLWGDLKSHLAEFTDGKSTLAPNQIREGCVIRAVDAPEHPEIGRVILKSISEAYLLRKDGSELT